MDGNGRLLTELTRDESVRLLGSVSLGRIVFTDRALPAIRPVNHIVDKGDVIVRSNLGTAVVSAANTARGVVVAYEADVIDPEEHCGWSVIVTGAAHLVHDAEEVARYEQKLHPWIDGEMDQVIRIHPEMVTGFRLEGESAGRSA